MKARLLREKGCCKEADDIVEKLCSGRFAQALNVQYQTAEYFWNAGEKLRAAGIYQQIRAADSRHYMANRRLAVWYWEQGQLQLSKECINVLLGFPMDEEVQKLVDAVNAAMEQELEQTLAASPDSIKTRLELGWCYLQDERTDEALALMEGIQPCPEQEKDYCNLMGKVYYYAKDYEKAVPMINRWLVLLTEQMPESLEKKMIRNVWQPVIPCFPRLRWNGPKPQKGPRKRQIMCWRWKKIRRPEKHITS